MANVDCTPERCTFQRKSNPSIHSLWAWGCCVVFLPFLMILSPFYRRSHRHYLPLRYRFELTLGGI